MLGRKRYGRVETRYLFVDVIVPGEPHHPGRTAGWAPASAGILCVRRQRFWAGRNCRTGGTSRESLTATAVAHRLPQGTHTTRRSMVHVRSGTPRARVGRCVQASPRRVDTHGGFRIVRLQLFVASVSVRNPAIARQLLAAAQSDGNATSEAFGHHVMEPSGGHSACRQVPLGWMW